MIYRFGLFELDTERRELRRGDTLVSLPPRLFALLDYLAEHNSRLVPKSELLDALWPANSSEASLQTAISQLRKALTDDPRNPVLIKTYHGRGFRLIAPLDSAANPAAAASPDDPAEPAPRLRETRPAAVLCVRLLDRAAIPPPAQRQAALEAAHAAARALVESHQGRLLHIMIDGFTAVFGLPQGGEDATRNALYCAADLASAAATADLSATGLIPSFAIHAGALELADSTDSTDWAPPTDLERTATALAGVAAAGEIVLSDAALTPLRDEIATRPRPGGDDAGHLLLSINQRRAGIPARPARPPSGFVGRGAEMAFLSACLDGLQRGRGQAVTLTGPPGIGKSRLTAEFLSRLDTDDLRPCVVNCLPALINTPLAPIRALAAALFADPPIELLNDAIDRALLAELVEDSAPPDPGLAALSDHQRRKRRHALLDRLLQTAAADRPLVVVFEDIHWIDASSRTLLGALIRGLDRRRVLLVLTTRPTDKPPLSEARLQLSPLGHDDSLALLRTRPELALAAAETVETLAQRGAGNPFFLEELALAVPGGADPARGLPGTVQAVISSRIGGLDERQRSLLFVMAVIGPPAPLPLAAALLGRSKDTLATDAEALVGAGFLLEEATGFVFRHMLINDTAYAMLAPDDRARLHGEAARLLEKDAAHPERLAWHYQEAGEIARAIQHWAEASRQALRRSAHHEAMAFADAAIALIAPDDPEGAVQEMELQLARALALTALRGYGAAEVGQAYDRAARLNRNLRSPVAGFQISIGLWLHNWVLGRLTRALDHANDLLATAALSNVPALKAQAHASAGEILVHQGKLAEGLAHLQDGVRHLRAAPPDSIPAQNAAVACAAYAGWAHALMGEATAARADIETSEWLRDLRPNPFAAAIHAGLCADILIFAGDAPGALELADEAIRISREHNFPFWLGTGLVERGWALAQLGQPRQGVAAAAEGIAIFEATGAGVQLANWYGFLAEAHLAAGQHQDGLAAANRALTAAEATGDIFFTPRIHAIAASLARRAGDATQAADHAAKARRLAGQIGIGTHLVAPETDG